MLLTPLLELLNSLFLYHFNLMQIYWDEDLKRWVNTDEDGQVCIASLLVLLCFNNMQLPSQFFFHFKSHEK